MFGVLEDAWLGVRVVVSDQRDKFMLGVTHPAARGLSTRLFDDDVDREVCLDVLGRAHRTGPWPAAVGHG